MDDMILNDNGKTVKANDGGMKFDENEISEKKKRQYAYALNMCTVSVSQIIDYADIVVLEQEYDAILNNLNLEKMPKDEALLKVLKLLLDTITFFRISEGDKAQIDKKYQFKMKNAIWNAVPNFGMIVAGGNPITMAVSLASQVGIGYMNYRKAKAENTLEYENEKWQLQRSAIEQFNGIRRELFDTSWRLSKEHGFEEKYRLTERQIKQYNEILNDPDYFRRYDRMKVISDNFEAYPPFWYHFGNTANSIAQSNMYSDPTKDKYKEEAKSHFEKYLSLSENSILRTDPITSACCLEYIDLLPIHDKKEKIKELIDKAITFSGGENDVLQLCVFAYLKIEDFSNAEDLLTRLINENYNRDVNGQLLSKLYFTDFIQHEEELDKAIDDEQRGVITSKLETITADYKLLTSRVNPQFLFPLPAIGEKNIDALRMDFENRQRYLLLGKYLDVLRQFFAAYNEKFNRCIPLYDEAQGIKAFGKNLYDDSQESKIYRIEQTKSVLENPAKAKAYSNKLYEADCWRSQLVLFEEMVTSLEKLACIKNIQNAVDDVKVRIGDAKDIRESIQKKLASNPLTITEYNEWMDKDFVYYTEGLIRIVCEDAFSHAQNCPVDGEFTIMDSEANLQDFVNINHLNDPDAFIINNLQESQGSCCYKYFADEILEVTSILQKIQKTRKEMSEKVSAYKSKVVEEGSSSKIYLYTEESFRVYFERNPNKKINKDRMIAIVENKGLSSDLLIGLDGVTQVIKPFRFLRKAAYDNYATKLNTTIKGIDEEELKNLFGELKLLCKSDNGPDDGREIRDSSILHLIGEIYNGDDKNPNAKRTSYSKNEPLEIIPMYEDNKPLYMIEDLSYYSKLGECTYDVAKIEAISSYSEMQQAKQQCENTITQGFEIIKNAVKNGADKYREYEAEEKDLNERNNRIIDSTDESLDRISSNAEKLEELKDRLSDLNENN